MCPNEVTEGWGFLDILRMKGWLSQEATHVIKGLEHTVSPTTWRAEGLQMELITTG